MEAQSEFGFDGSSLGEIPKIEKSPSAHCPRDGGRQIAFPQCPRCLSYALYRKGNIGNFECCTCGMQETSEAVTSEPESQKAVKPRINTGEILVPVDGKRDESIVAWPGFRTQNGDKRCLIHHFNADWWLRPGVGWVCSLCYPNPERE